MTIPDSVFSCCCDWGFEFNQKPIPPVVYIAAQLSFASSSMYLDGFNKSNLNPSGYSQFLNASFFDDALDNDFRRTIKYCDIDEVFYTAGYYLSSVDSDENFSVVRFNKSLTKLSEAIKYEYSLAAKQTGGGIYVPQNYWSLGDSRNIYITSASSTFDDAPTDIKNRRMSLIASRFTKTGTHSLTVSKAFTGTLYTGGTSSQAGYEGFSISSLPSGIFHVTGRWSAYASTSSLTPFYVGPMEIQYDSDGNEIWSHIPEDADKMSYGTQCEFLDNGNVVCAYTYDTGYSDSLRLVIYDPSGSVVASYTNSTFSSLVRITAFENSVILKFGGTLQKRSGSDLSTVDWSVTDSGTASVDEFGDVYTMTGSLLRKRSGADGTSLATRSLTHTPPVNFPIVPPGFSPCQI